MFIVYMIFESTILSASHILNTLGKHYPFLIKGNYIFIDARETQMT